MMGRTKASPRWCAMCGRDLAAVDVRLLEYAGRLFELCSDRCLQRFGAVPGSRLIVSPASGSQSAPLA